MGGVCSSPKQLFFDAVSTGDVNKVNALLSRKGKARAFLNEKDKHGYTALHIAAENGHTSIVRSLLERKANVNATTDTGFTALAIACKNGNDNCVRTIIDANPELEKVDLAFGQNPLMWAVQTCKADTVQAILDSPGMNKRMLEVKSRFGTTALMMAVEANSGTRKLDIIRALLSAGANVNTKDSRGRTALSIAKDKGLKDVEKELSKGTEDNEEEEEEVSSKAKKSSSKSEKVEKAEKVSPKKSTTSESTSTGKSSSGSKSSSSSSKGDKEFSSSLTGKSRSK